MNSKETIINSTESLKKLREYIERENFRGYDPYDIHNSSLPTNKIPHSIQFLASQLNKRTPINLRPLLKIKQAPHSKAMGLFLAGYSNLIKLKEEAASKEHANSIYQWIKINRSAEYSAPCWGFDYDYSSRQGYVKKGLPTVVHHKYILQGLYKYYQVSQTKDIYDIISKCDKFIIQHIPKIKYPDGKCFGYYPKANGCCYNASLKAAESLALVDKIKQTSDYIEDIALAVQYVISKQKESGAWYYSHGENPSVEKQQIDFHQGFILDSLDEINQLTNNQLAPIIQPAIKKGLEFYYNKQFDKQGRCYYRYPQKFPIDIHNQAQGILTFSRFSKVKQEYEDMADKITNWTIKNMQDKSGYFYYQKYRFFTNKIPYIRWGQAWMFWALTERILLKLSKK